MSKHNETGIKGEQIAKNFLVNNGFAVLYTNWTFGKMEVDIIASKGDTLAFVEVKTRTSHYFGYPEEAVSKKKRQYLKAAATAYINVNPDYYTVRFDIISILMDGETPKEVIHFEDAFF